MRIGRERLPRRRDPRRRFRNRLLVGMVGVAIDGPLGENGVGRFGGESAGEGVIVGVIDNGAAIDLIGESRAGFEDAAGILSFGGADGGRGRTVCDVDEHHRGPSRVGGQPSQAGRGCL